MISFGVNGRVAIGSGLESLVRFFGYITFLRSFGNPFRNPWPLSSESAFAKAAIAVVRSAIRNNMWVCLSNVRLLYYYYWSGLLIDSTYIHTYTYLMEGIIYSCILPNRPISHLAFRSFIALFSPSGVFFNSGWSKSCQGQPMARHPGLPAKGLYLPVI